MSPTIYQRLSTIESVLGIDTVAPPDQPTLIDRVARLEDRLSAASVAPNLDLSVYLPGVSGPGTYRSVPGDIDAIQWTGYNGEAVANFVGPHPHHHQTCGFQVSATAASSGPYSAKLWVAANDAWVTIETDEWVAKDERGFYLIKDDVFQRKYREAENPNV